MDVHGGDGDVVEMDDDDDDDDDDDGENDDGNIVDITESPGNDDGGVFAALGPFPSGPSSSSSSSSSSSAAVASVAPNPAAVVAAPKPKPQTQPQPAKVTGRKKARTAAGGGIPALLGSVNSSIGRLVNVVAPRFNPAPAAGMHLTFDQMMEIERMKQKTAEKQQAAALAQANAHGGPQ